MLMRYVTLALAVCASLRPASSAAAPVIYKVHHPPTVATDEINNSWPVGASAAGTAGTLIAAAKMGVRFFGSEEVEGTDSDLLSTCKSNTPAGSTWPEKCDISGLVIALNMMFPQNWVAVKWNETPNDKDAAVKRIIDSLAVHRTPVVVPLGGSADHWITLFQITADLTTTPYALSQVKFLDGGDSGDLFDPYVDSRGTLYTNGIQTMSGSMWQGNYYRVIENVGTTDPYYGKFVAVYDPPADQSVIDADRAVQISYMRAPSVLLDGEEMDAQIASERVWDALFWAGAYDSTDWGSSIEHGTPGKAWAVYGQTFEGEPSDYYVIPILNDEGAAAALVRLSMEDGAFEHLWVLDKPMPFLGVSPEEAAASAREVLAEGEELWGGALVWEPRRAYARSPLLPYYEFHILGASGEYHGSIAVGLADGQVRGIEHTRSMQAAAPRSRT